MRTQFLHYSGVCQITKHLVYASRKLFLFNLFGELKIKYEARNSVGVSVIRKE